MKAFTRSLFWVSVTVSALTLAGCKETDADKVGDAQYCLDRYVRDGVGNVADCVSKVAGVNTPGAQGIRCSAGFIQEGFGSAQPFIDAFKELETVTPTTVRNFLRLITFDSAGDGNSTNVDANYNSIRTTYGYCAESRAKGATMISTFSYLTNLLYKYNCDNGPGSGFLGSCNMDDNSLLSALGVAYLDVTPSTVALQTELGELIISTNDVSCSTGASNDTLCDFMERAITGGGGTAAGVGKEFLRVIANP